MENFPKSQRFVLGQRLSNHVMDVLGAQERFTTSHRELLINDQFQSFYIERLSAS